MTQIQTYRPIGHLVIVKDRRTKSSHCIKDYAEPYTSTSTYLLPLT
ncbi:hypothetical protein SDJN02_27483, partial [Cucurbita argyrosperma subsp. argyrosperma]